MGRQCTQCQNTIVEGALRIGKRTPNPFDHEGELDINWYHPKCIFYALERACVGMMGQRVCMGDEEISQLVVHAGTFSSVYI